LCENGDFCTDACGGCVGYRASGEAVGLIRSIVRGPPAPHEATDALTPQRGRFGLGPWHSQGKRRKGQAVLAACLRSQGPLGRESPNPLGSTANVGGTMLSSASRARVIRSFERIPLLPNGRKTRASYIRITSAVAVDIGRDALFHRRLRPYRPGSSLLAALSRTPVTLGPRCSASARGARRPQTRCVTRVLGFQGMGEGRALHRRGGLHACRSLGIQPSATPTGGGQGCDRWCSYTQSRIACCPYATNIGNKAALDCMSVAFRHSTYPLRDNTGRTHPTLPSVPNTFGK
jgi:hypothetical protein